MATRKVWEYDHSDIIGRTPPDKAKWFATWGMDCPGDNLAWSQYIMVAFDLTSITVRPPIIHLPGATHEVQVWAVNPDFPLPEKFDEGSSYGRMLLHPMNMGYQFIAPSNEAAHSRLRDVAHAVATGILSPDTDYRSAWDIMFSDGETLLVGHSLQRRH
jgi:hypothetical protein